MRLSIKIVIIIFAIFMGMVALLHGVTTSLILSSFARLEETNIRTNLDRVLNTLEQDLKALESTGGDWGAWDDTRDFIGDLNKEYIAGNLSVITLENLHVNFMIFFNDASDPIYKFGIKLGEETEEAPVSEELISWLRRQKSLFIHRDSEDAKTGIIQLSEERAIITVWPISNDNMDGPVTGTLIMGRYLDNDLLNSLEQRTQLDMDLQRIDDNRMPDDFIKAKAELKSGNKIAINRDRPEIISAYVLFKDVLNNDSIIIRVSRARDIFKQGQKTANYFRWVQFIVGIAFLAVLLLTLRYVVVKPISILKEHILSVAKSGDLSTRLSLETKDEIGILAREFDRMLEQLSDARNRLMEQSYYSGIGEMASGVLHNLRNILTPIVGQIGSIRDRLIETPVDNIERATTELNSEDLDEVRERSLKRYLYLAVPNLRKINHEIGNSLMLLSRHASHMEEVLSRQEQFANHKKIFEPLDISMAIDEAIGLMPEQLKNAADIHKESGLAHLPLVSAERVVLIQVLTNILNNASESILRSGGQRGKIWISGDSEGEGDLKKVHIVITDNGEGIEKEDQRRIFSRGYSKKTPKSSGVGLHWCGNVMSAMKADLYVESAGLGHGSSFHIRLQAFRDQSFLIL